MLIHCVGEELEDHPELPPELERSIANWEAEVTGRGVLLEGDRLQAARRARTVREPGRCASATVTDGPFAETKELVVG